MLLLSVFCFAGGNQESVESKVGSAKLVIGTGGTSGTYYPVGGILKTIFEEDEAIRSITVESTGASVANLQNIDSGVNQMAIVMSDVAFDAAQGKGKFDSPVNFKALAGLYPNVVQIVATIASGVKNVQDLKGKRVGVGKVGSGVEQSATKVFESAGMTYKDLAQTSHTGYADSVQSMKNGNLDAAFFTSGVPNSSIIEAMQSLDVVFVPIVGTVADTLLKNYPYYVKHSIPAGDSGKYNLPAKLQTVAIRNLLVVHSDLSDDITYILAKHFYEYLGSDRVSINALKQFDRETMDKGLVVEVATGAQRFYNEQ